MIAVGVVFAGSYAAFDKTKETINRRKTSVTITTRNNDDGQGFKQAITASSVNSSIHVVDFMQAELNKTKSNHHNEPVTNSMSSLSSLFLFAFSSCVAIIKKEQQELNAKNYSSNRITTYVFWSNSLCIFSLCS